MVDSGRIERKPEYDTEDWVAVGKLKEFVEEQGFTFGEQEGEEWRYFDCTIGWNVFYASTIIIGKKFLILTKC